MMRRFGLLAFVMVALAVAGCTEENPGTGDNNTDSDAEVRDADAGDGGGDEGDADTGVDPDDGGTDADDGGGGDDGGEDGGDDAGLDGGDEDDGGADASDAGDGVEPSIQANDQFLAAADSNRVTVESAVSDGPGWAVIHADDNGAPGEIVGQAALQDGENDQIEVELDRDAENGESFHAMLHVDAGEEGTFEPDQDEAVLDDNDEPITDEFVVDLPSVETQTELVDDLSTVIPVQSVVSKGDGWIVLHEGPCTDDAGDPAFGPALGQASVDDGQNDDLEVAISRPAQDDEDLCAMLHLDEPNDGDFTFDPNAQDPDDPPATLAESEEIIMSSFSVQIPDGTPAVRITLSNNGMTDYTFDDVEPDIHDDGMEGNDDPDLVLNQGWRYEIDNTAANEHPFEFMRTGVGNQEQVVFSQDVEGEGENDPDAEWDESGDSMLFTVSGTYFGEGTVPREVEYYRCTYHQDEMTGNIVIQQP